MEQIFELRSSSTVPLTRAMAEEMRNMKPSPTERALDQNRVAYLRGRADEGLLIPFNWGKARVNGEWMRMNGQHSSEMLCNLPDDVFPTALFVHMDEYAVRDYNSLATLFQQFDPRKSSRTPTDVAGAYKGLHKELNEVPLSIAKLGADGVCYYFKRVLGKPVGGGDLKYEIFGDQTIWPFLLWIPEIFSIKTPELKRPEIVAAMYATFDVNEVGAKTFWKEVAAGGNDTKENHPTMTLDEWYKKAKEETDRKKKPKPHEFYQAGVSAWNAFRDDRPLVTIKKIKSDPEVHS